MLLMKTNRRHFTSQLGKDMFLAHFNYFATIKEGKTELLRSIESGLKLLRHGNRVRTSLMSEEERRFMWNVGFVLTKKHPAIAFRTYHSIRSFVTFHGIFIGPGYDQGKESIWRKVVDIEDSDW